MKKIVYIMILALVAGSCVTYRGLDLNVLTTGMSKAEVRDLIGLPDRVLAVSQTENGYQEVLEYRTSTNEVYALEFWNDYLTGYEFLYDDVDYTPTMVPPMWYPEPGRPIFPPGYYPSNPNRPNRPNRPNQPNRPNRPSTPSYPNRPNQPNRPEQPNRPTIDNSNMTRPTPGVGPSTSRPSSRPSSTQSSSTDRSGLAK